MDDTKLLELAGRAAGEKYGPENNPLNRDDLALRLAVKLGLSLDTHCTRVCYGLELSASEQGFRDIAATRRAIVRAAAEIGKAMT